MKGFEKTIEMELRDQMVELRTEIKADLVPSVLVLGALAFPIFMVFGTGMVAAAILGATDYKGKGLSMKFRVRKTDRIRC